MSNRKIFSNTPYNVFRNGSRKVLLQEADFTLNIKYEPNLKSLLIHL